MKHLCTKLGRGIEEAVIVKGKKCKLDCTYLPRRKEKENIKIRNEKKRKGKKSDGKEGGGKTPPKPDPTYWGDCILCVVL